MSVRLTIEWPTNLDRKFLPNDPTLMGAAMPGRGADRHAPPGSTFRRAVLGVALPGWLRAAASGALRLQG
jgi:hypothetical protein